MVFLKPSQMARAFESCQPIVVPASQNGFSPAVDEWVSVNIIEQFPSG